PRLRKNTPVTSTAKKRSGARWCASSISRWNEPRRYRQASCAKAQFPRLSSQGSGAQRELDAIAERQLDRDIAAARLADIVEVGRQRLRRDIEIVSHDQRARRELRLQETQHGQVGLLPAVEQKQIDAAAEAGLERPERVADAKVDELGQARGAEVMRGPFGLDRIELGGDEAAAAAGIPQRRCEMDAGDAERGSELYDELGAATARQHVEQAADVRRDRHVHVTHQLGPLALVRRVPEPLERGVRTFERRRVAAVRLCKQLREQAGNGGRIESGHGAMNSAPDHVRRSSDAARARTSTIFASASASSSSRLAATSRRLSIAARTSGETPGPRRSSSSLSARRRMRVTRSPIASSRSSTASTKSRFSSRWARPS